MLKKISGDMWRRGEGESQPYEPSISKKAERNGEFSLDQ